ncbi:fibronectin type III domain-containing protein [Streptomyces sp. IB2014 016-6]|uniref:fibronectin type III domain-containing protein n=1 Tax=Streptomyces sp. IB2014 016-6 TaxID=2517818 RepID=UPI0011CC7584|nr:fibronectin type III domain-containing protein [Streptomyces sp. IB2014 016-6]TXL85519.1 fibronectin type III domain-containing protein [Streptomyces sp. IB2014 016-6]
MPLRLRATIAAALTTLTLAGCSSPPEEREEPRTSARLAATLDSPVDITLRWKDDEPAVAGRTVEFATEKAGPYTVLEFVPPGRTTYRHPDLMPETPFYYRLRPYFGPASPAVEVSLPPGEPSEKELTGNQEWLTPRTVEGPKAPKARTAPVTARGAGGADANEAAAPADFEPTVKHATGIHFSWTDRAADEDGYLLEVRQAGSEGYRPVALLDPDINSFGLITLPEEKRASYRVRAFVYGEQSNVVHLTTGSDPGA